MSTPTPQQLIAAQQASLETLFGFANQAFATVEKLVALNRQNIAGRNASYRDQGHFGERSERTGRAVDEPVTTRVGKGGSLRPSRT
jgi:hypothetical protein